MNAEQKFDEAMRRSNYLSALRKAYDSLFVARDQEYRRAGMTFSQMLYTPYVDTSDPLMCQSLINVVKLLHGSGMERARALDLEARCLLAEVMQETSR